MNTKKSSVETWPSSAPLPGDFRQAMSFEELAAAQGVGLLINIDALVGAWPGDVNDGFEEVVRIFRQANLRTGWIWMEAR